MATAAPPTVPIAAAPVVWYRSPSGDHAFAAGDGWMHSACGDVRWTVRLQLVEGTVQPCVRCLAVLAPQVAPLTESELRLLDGNR